MRKSLGVLTQDFRLYHDLVAALKARDLPFVKVKALELETRPVDAPGRA